jgi:rhodanese-related sulfurtransferase
LALRATTLAKTKANTMLSETSSPALPRDIDTAELAARLRDPQPPIVAEILGPQSFEAGHLPGAINLPLEGFIENAQRRLPEKTAEIVVYCSSVTCQNSHVAQRKLASVGYQNVRLYRGGKAAWKEAGLPLAVA